MVNNEIKEYRIMYITILARKGKIIFIAKKGIINVYLRIVSLI